MELIIKNSNGEDTGRKVNLPESIFNIEPNDHAIYLDVKQYLANQRQGTHKSKERAEITGSTKKIKRQKGTGTARAGSIKSPVFVGGGRVFGPKPRDYSFKLNKKLKDLAKKSVLTYKAKDNQIAVLEKLDIAAPKTKDYLKLLTNLAVNEKKTLFILPEPDQNIYLSSRNLKNSKVTTVNAISTYDLLHCDWLILSENAVEKIENLLSK
ncbi:MAG: 50S ribosomal protein L4 [Candidatus Cyclobacteriaceae bacterium M3_2C_046]